MLQLFRKVKSKNYKKLDREQFFEKLKDFYVNWPKNKVIRTRWGKIYDPINFINEAEKEKINIGNILWNLELPKKKREHLKILADIISDSYLLTDEELSDFDLLLEKIKKQEEQLVDIYIDMDSEPCSILKEPWKNLENF